MRYIKNVKNWTISDPPITASMACMLAFRASKPKWQIKSNQLVYPSTESAPPNLHVHKKQGKSTLHYFPFERNIHVFPDPSPRLARSGRKPYLGAPSHDRSLEGVYFSSTMHHLPIICEYPRSICIQDAGRLTKITYAPLSSLMKRAEAL